MRQSTETGTYDEGHPLPVGRLSSSTVGGDSTTADQGSSATTIKIDLGKSVSAIALCAAICGATLVASIVACVTAYNAKTEARVVEYYLMDPHYRTPDEMAAWAKFRDEHK